MKRLVIFRKSDDQPVLELLQKNDEVQVLGDFLGFELLSKKKLEEVADIIHRTQKYGSRLEKDEGDADDQLNPQEVPIPEAPTPDVGSLAMIASESINDRIAPALKILKDLLLQAEKKREEKADAESIVEEAALASQAAEVVLEQPELVFVSVDGDNIGNAVARAEANDNELEIKEMSEKINQGQEVLKQWAIAHSGTVIQQGGDEGLVKVPNGALNEVEQLRKDYEAIVGATLTIGVGKTISQSTKARMLGKLRGKDQVCYFEEDSTEEELKLRLKDKDQSQSAKVEESGVISDNA